MGVQNWMHVNEIIGLDRQLPCFILLHFVLGPFVLFDNDNNGFISLSEWLNKAKQASRNYGVKLTEDELKEMFSSMACSDDKISSKNFKAIINDEIVDVPCANERGP